MNQLARNRPPPHHTPLPPTLTRRLFLGHHTIVSRARHRVNAQQRPNTNAEPDHDPMETVITIAWND
jgi:hypothetical protein